MSKYTITIKNEEGKVVFEEQTGAMIAGIANGQEASAIVLKGTEDELIVAVNMVQSEIDRLFRED